MSSERFPASSMTDAYLPDRPLFDALIRPNSSLSERGCRQLLAAIMIAGVAFQIVLISGGMWPAAIFVGFDVFFLAAAVVACRRKLERYEQVTIHRGQLSVIRGNGRQTSEPLILPVYGLSLEQHDDPDHGTRALSLVLRNQRHPVACDLSPAERREFGLALLEALHRAGGTPRHMVRHQLPYLQP